MQLFIILTEPYGKKGEKAKIIKRRNISTGDKWQFRCLKETNFIE